MRIHFVLVGEGRSDEGLVPHIERLLIFVGASEVTGTAPDFASIPGHTGHTVADKLRTALALEPSANLFLVHRDADGRDPSPRFAEISAAVAAMPLVVSAVALVPVQETEAWLLVDEVAIRTVAGNPNGRAPLALPAPRRVEDVANPKEVLERALLIASGFTGRRAARFRNRIGAKRRQLLEQLPVGGPLEHVPAWVRFRQDLADVLRRR